MCDYENRVSHDEVRGANVKGKSRVEKTMEQDQGTVYMHPDFLNSFVVKTFEKGGNTFPCHPDNTRRYSKIAVGFESCLDCGTSHMFRYCPTNKTQQSNDNFHLSCIAINLVYGLNISLGNEDLVIPL